MSVQAIIDKIALDAETQASAVRAEAEQKKADIEARTKQVLAQLQQEYAHAQEKKQEHLRSVRLSRAKQAGNQSLQAAKRDMVDQVFTDAFVTLRDEPSDRYIARFTKMCQSYDIDPASITHIVTASNREDETRAIAKEMGWETVDVTVDPKLEGGMVVVGPTESFDLSLEGLYAARRAELEVEVAEQLFQS